MYGCHTTWRKKTFLPVWMHANRFWIATKSTRFWSGWWLAMKNGSLTTTWSANGRGRTAVRLPRRWPSLDRLSGRFFCVFDYELLAYGQTLNSDLYCQQLVRLNSALMQKRPSLINRRRIVFHQDRKSGRSDGWFICIHRIVRISHQVITTYFCPWRTS